ncbi:hypothetical protein HELRODRAFT_156213 [Helobdella robusta]|uniref:Glutamate decarboxylase n=1 Tax=Helobdella robusta TaxID=6412 RepID=T1ELS9_HELRO|nr:hypothetical protein HELRODRAFT_156213 [Helobdella robusta]ESN90749.1 hypothetical protein HELRODRAFT_156213 [Helobdella robusta]
MTQILDPVFEITDEPESLEELLKSVKLLLKYSTKVGHRRKLNNPSTSFDVISLAGEMMTSTTNTNMFTYEIAPVYTLIEGLVLDQMRTMVGWPPSQGDGIFAPGASMANMYAICVARHKFIPSFKNLGMVEQRKDLIVFTTSQCNPSTPRSAAIIGVGLKNVIFVDCNERGQMSVTDLERKIVSSLAAGSLPFFVSATSGSAMLGSFDSLTEIADVCDKYNLWLHVDASHGGGVMFSANHIHLVRGIRRAHSVTWNCHMMMNCTLQCSAILIREKGLLEACNSTCATYLFQQDKHYDVAYDTGDKAIQCGRHNDVYKLWLLWRSKGHTGMSDHVVRLFKMAAVFQEKLKSTPGVCMVLPEMEFVTICFWYVPEKMLKMTLKIPLNMLKFDWLEGNNNNNNYKNINNNDDNDNNNNDWLPTFYKVVINNSATTSRDIDYVINQMKRLADEEVNTLMMMK